MLPNDLIAAIATPPGRGAIGAVRLSGEGAVDLLARVFLPRRAPERWRSRHMTHGRIAEAGRVADEVMAVVYRAPRSYTGEESAEIFTHGGRTTAAVLYVLLRAGARLAEPGEFTRRAFVNGRMDLAQAEAVVSLINAQTDAAAQAGLRQLRGGLSRTVTELRERILQWLAHIELSIDYPEHGDEAMNLREISSQIPALREKLTRLTDSYRVGRVLADGLRAVILGRPNVGKSSLFNAILREERAIVTDIPGTTRDVVTEPVYMGAVPVQLADTAGVRETDGAIERMGVERSLDRLRDAELVLWVLDRSAPPSAEDVQLAGRLRERIAAGPAEPGLPAMGECLPALAKREGIDPANGLRARSARVSERTIPSCGTQSRTQNTFPAAAAPAVFALLNKCDLPPHAAWADGGPIPEDMPVLEISAREGTGLAALYAGVERRFADGLANAAAEADIVTRARHFQLLTEAGRQLDEAADAIGAGRTEDLVSLHLGAAYRSLGQILGLETDTDVCDRIFSEFCVGK